MKATLYAVVDNYGDILIYGGNKPKLYRETEEEYNYSTGRTTRKLVLHEDGAYDTSIDADTFKSLVGRTVPKNKIAKIEIFSNPSTAVKNLRRKLVAAPVPVGVGLFTKTPTLNDTKDTVYSDGEFHDVNMASDPSQAQFCTSGFTGATGIQVLAPTTIGLRIASLTTIPVRSA